MNVIARFALIAFLLGASGSAASAGSINAEVVDASGKPLENAIVYALPRTPATGSKPVEISPVKIDQIDKEFVPRVSAIQTGTPVAFPNSDNIRHQVYSFSPAKTFTLKLYSGQPSEPVVFDKPGLVVLGCNIHDHMVAWLLIVDTPWFVRTNAAGRANLKNLPAGSYDLMAWHPGVAEPVATGALELAEDASVDRRIALAAAEVPRLSPAPASE